MIMDGFSSNCRWARKSTLLTSIVAAIILSLVKSAQATGPPKTSIYIDQIPLYNELPQCAQDPVSAIIRAQSSGCGDDMQLTSFSCFCVQGSAKFSSIISTAVSAGCAATTSARATRSTTKATVSLPPNPGPTKGVSSALELFHSYCERTTELPWYADNSTQTTPPTVTITTPPQTITAPPASTSTAPPSSSSKKTNAAAIAVPVVLIPLLIGGIGLFFFLRRRQAKRNQVAEMYAGQAASDEKKRGVEATEVGDGSRGELPGDYRNRQEVAGSSDVGSGPVKYAYELQTGDVQRAELYGGEVKDGKGGVEKK